MKLHNIPFSPPDIGPAEAQEVTQALLSGWITTGPRTKEFEREIAAYCHTEKAVCLNSATACMEMILRVLGVGPGDEVITSAYTYTATASVTCHVGAKVVLVDTAPGSFEMDYDKLADAITEKTKVVIPVDLAGIVCDYDRIFAAVVQRINYVDAAVGNILVRLLGDVIFGDRRDVVLIRRRHPCADGKHVVAQIFDRIFVRGNRLIGFRSSGVLVAAGRRGRRWCAPRQKKQRQQRAEQQSYKSFHFKIPLSS